MIEGIGFPLYWNNLNQHREPSPVLGIEALIGIQSELRYRLSIQIAVFLEEDKTRRIDIYKNIKKMYDIRSKVVHGGKIDDETIVKHIIDAKDILCKLLVRIIERNSMPTSDDFDELLLE